MKLFDRIFNRDPHDPQVLSAEVAVGDAFKTWIQSDVGRYIAGRAEQYELAVLKELAQTDPKETVKIIKLQAQSELPGKLLQWIEEAIEQGEIAEYQLAQMEEY